ncbi:MAG: family 78 glycoside hydrolase catalytic domain [Clostridia bacterium]|nr:family 78 glycoside hydrolase catalytic domain [Clostridia bacterium]
MPLTIHSTTCEYQENALGIDKPNPVIGWKLASDTNGARQTAYRISVFGENGETVWDSGKVISDRQFGIEIEPENKLTPMSEYTFTVMVWDETDSPSRPVTAKFVTGFFKAHQWRGDWLRIWHYGSIHFYRREFTLNNTAAIRYAYAFIGAFGDKGNSCVPFINGKRVEGFVCFPGASEYFTAQYVCRDVKDMLKEGQNAIGLMLANTSSVIIKIKYTDGTEVYVDCRREEWKTKTGGGYSLGYGESMQHGKYEEYDARSAFEGWTEAGFDDSDWEPAGENNPIIDLAPLFLRQHTSPVRIASCLKPISITARNDAYIADFGTNLAGFVSLRIKGKVGKTVEIRYSEKLDDGAPVLDSWRGAYNKYTFASDGIEEYTPLFMYTGFRYVVIHDCDDTPELTAHRICSDVEYASRFACSDEEINAIYETARRSFLSNLINIPTDCPERERRGWTADAYAVCEAECVNFDVRNFYTQWLESMRDSQRGNGWIPVELPLSTDDCIDVNWPAAAVIIPFTLYGQYEDVRFIRRFLPMMKSWVSLLEEICDDDFTISERYLSYKDWIAAEPASPRFLATAYFFRCADLLAKLCDAAGDKDIERFASLAASIRCSLNGKYLKSDANGIYYDNNSQSANAHALYFGICPDELRSAVTASLVSDIDHKHTPTCGFMGTACLLEALSQNGRSDVALRVLKNRNKGGWLYLINECEATAFPEHFNGGGSQNHAFLGSAPALWLVKRLAGISPELPGYKKVRIEPYIPDGAEHAEATVDALYGEIAAAWKKTQDGTTLEVTLPPNVTGTVVFGGKTHEIDSGTYSFKA